jgi:hypothetical protein
MLGDEIEADGQQFRIGQAMLTTILWYDTYISIPAALRVWENGAGIKKLGLPHRSRRGGSP